MISMSLRELLIWKRRNQSAVSQLFDEHAEITWNEGIRFALLGTTSRRLTQIALHNLWEVCDFPSTWRY